MVLIIGGACQGKLKFAFDLLGKELRRELYASGEEDSFEEALVRPVINEFHLYIKRLLREEREAFPFTQRLLAENPESLVIINELGCGIVPADPFDREYRDAAGRAAQRLAAEAAEVYRVICGIAVRIK